MRPATMVERACPNDGVNMIPIVDRFAKFLLRGLAEPGQLREPPTRARFA